MSAENKGLRHISLYILKSHLLSDVVSILSIEAIKKNIAYVSFKQQFKVQQS